MEIEMRYVIIGSYGSHEKILALASTEEDARRGVTYYKAIGYKDVDYVEKKVETFKPLPFLYKGHYVLKVLPTENENVYKLQYVIGVRPDKDYIIDGKTLSSFPYINVEFIKNYNCSTRMENYYIEINFTLKEFPESTEEIEKFLVETANDCLGGKFTITIPEKEVE